MGEEEKSRVDKLREDAPRIRRWRIPAQGIIEDPSQLQAEIGLDGVITKVNDSKNPIMIELRNAMHRIPASYRSHEEMAKPGTLHDPIAEIAYVYSMIMANPNNVDMEMFFGAYEMSQEAKAMTANLLGLKPTFSVDNNGEWEGGFAPHHVGGWFLNGGTESINQALWAFRNSHIKEKLGSDVVRSQGYRALKPGDIPVVLAPVNAHFALDESMDILGLGKQDPGITRFYLNLQGRPDLLSVKKQVRRLLAHGTPEIFTVFITAGDTERGVISDTRAIVKVLKDEYKRKGLEDKLPPILVDAAAQYMFAAVMEDSEKYVDVKGNQKELPVWDFRVPEVSAIVTDPHKNQIPYPCSILIYRNPELANATQMEEAYLSNDMLKHVTGMPPDEMGAAQACAAIPTSRAAYGAIATWAYYVANGLDKIRERKENVWENVLHVWQALDDGELGEKYELLFEPDSAIINMRLRPQWINDNVNRLDSEVVRKAERVAEAYEDLFYPMQASSVLAGELTFKVYEEINKFKGDMLYIGKSTDLLKLSEEGYSVAREVGKILPFAGKENTGLIVHIMEHNRVEDMDKLASRLGQEAEKLIH